MARLNITFTRHRKPCPVCAAQRSYAVALLELGRQTSELEAIRLANARAEEQRDRAEQILDRLKDFAGDIRDDIKKHRKEVESAARSKR